jgi:hypothetical protein
MPSLRAQDHAGAYPERLALEGGNRFANSIRGLNKNPRECFLERPNVGGKLLSLPSQKTMSYQPVKSEDK